MVATNKGAKDLFIVDNSESEWSVSRYLKEWCDISSNMDIATGYFDISALLDLNEKWQNVDKIRILFGGEVSRRTKTAFMEGVKGITDYLDISIDNEKEQNEFLLGVPAIIRAIKERKIEFKYYKKSKFHAKAYLTYFKKDILNQIPSAANVPDGVALVGSSNFTYPGLNQNIELNVQVRNNLSELQQWFDYYWDEADQIDDEVIEVITKHVKEYTPYDVYLKSMYEYFKDSAESVTEWENNTSRIYNLLERYQKDGYHSLMKIAHNYGGAFLCDGVGLGKTYIGLMLIERLLMKENKRVLLLVPAAARKSVWETKIKELLPFALEGFIPFRIINHTDLALPKNKHMIEQMAEQADCIIIDEAHHFRNRDSKRYRELFNLIGMGQKKQLFMLTATPINNSFLDLQHMIELFTQRNDQYFQSAPLGISSVIGHFRKMEANLEKNISKNENQKIKTYVDINDYKKESEDIFIQDKLVNALVVQRSRSYTKKSSIQAGGTEVLFPNRMPPIVAKYSLQKSYGNLIEHFVDSFDRINRKTNRPEPILSLAIYAPYDKPYFKGSDDDVEPMKKGRQMQIVQLIRILLLKRFESSPAAFEATCSRIFRRLYKFVTEYKSNSTERLINKFEQRRRSIIDYVYGITEFDDELDKYDVSEDDFPDYVWEVEENLSVNDFDIDLIIEDSLSDLEVLCLFLDDLKRIHPEEDDKLNKLIHLLTEDPLAAGKKIIIFTEFRSTALYLYEELQKNGLKNIFELDGETKVNREEVIRRFSPYYNGSSSQKEKDEIQILITTDVLSEGLNLQDASRMINYDLHWNPVRLMQRIGRVDRRLNLNIEKEIISNRPDLELDRKNVYYWNFLPPEELNQLLSLYSNVTKKTLRISKTFGIEGRKLLTPDDDYEALKEFNMQYEGKETKDEELRLEYEKLMKEIPDFEELVRKFPKRFYSGKAANLVSGIFFCYKLPNKTAEGEWIKDGLTKWYFYDIGSEEIVDDVYHIWKTISCEPNEPRTVNIDENLFKVIRKKINKHIEKTYLRPVQAPVNFNEQLITWLKIN